MLSSCCRGNPVHEPGHVFRWLVVPVALVLALAVCHPLRAAGQPEYRGRPLLEVLQELQDRGLELIFSTAVVGESLRVSVEPSASDPRSALDEILEPLGLEARDGPAGSIMILPQGQATGGLQGRVVMAGLGTPVAGASLNISGRHHAATSAADGAFEIPGIPVGTYQIVVEAPGFSPATFNHVRVTRDSVSELSLRLTLLSDLVTQVVVTPGRHSVVWDEQSASHSIDEKDAVLVPTIAGDVSRVIELLPGVAAQNNSAAFNVRGSTTQDFSIVLDSMELYDPFHFQSFQSPFTTIDTRIVDRMDLLTGGFTAELGDRHGGFVEISTLGPGSRGHGEVELGTLNSRVSYRSQASEGATGWLVSARAWYPEAWRDSVELGGGEQADPRFEDVYAKVALVATPRTVLSVHTLLVHDELSFSEIPEEDDELGERANALTRNGYLWVRMLNSWNSQVTSETVLSGGRIERRRDGLSQPQDDAFIVNDDRRVNFVGLKNDSTWQISNRHVLKVGAEARRLNSRYDYAVRPFDPDEEPTSVSLDPDGTSIGVYAAHRVRISDNLATEVGLRWDRQNYTDDNQVSPRVNALWRIGERSELRVGLGRFSQSQRIHELHVEDGEVEFLGAEVSQQAEITFQRTMGRGLRFRVDAYYRKLSSLRPRYENLFSPVELFPETGDDRVVVSPTGARLQGVEFLLRGDPSRSLAWWVSYALSSADDKIDGRDEPRNWDQTHAGKFLIGYRWGDRWVVSLVGNVHTGWPTTPVSGEITMLPDGTTEVEPVLGRRNSERYSTYARLDAKVRRSFTLPHGRLWLTLEVVNLTDRDNVCCVDEFTFEPRPDGSVEVRNTFDFWLGVTPSFSVLWEF